LHESRLDPKLNAIRLDPHSSMLEPATTRPSTILRRREAKRTPLLPAVHLGFLFTLFTFFAACTSTSSSPDHYAAFESHRFT
jgi:hypothetical protein